MWSMAHPAGEVPVWGVPNTPQSPCGVVLLYKVSPNSPQAFSSLVSISSALAARNFHCHF